MSRSILLSGIGQGGIFTKEQPAHWRNTVACTLPGYLRIELTILNDFCYVNLRLPHTVRETLLVSSALSVMGI